MEMLSLNLSVLDPSLSCCGTPEKLCECIDNRKEYPYNNKRNQLFYFLIPK